MARHPLRAAIAGALTGFAVAFVATAPFAVASNFGGPKDSNRECDATQFSQCVAQNASHRIYLGMLPGSGSSDDVVGPMRWAMDNSTTGGWDVTDMTMIEDMTYDDGGDEDVIGYYGDFGYANGAVGFTRCWANPTATGTLNFNHSHGHDWCRPQSLIWNTRHKDAWQGSTTKKRALACHELGHTIGLRHSSGVLTCMKTYPVDAPVSTDIREHDIDHINDHY